MTTIKVEPCHPSRDFSDCTCYTLQQLTKMAKHLNKQGHDIPITDNKKDIWKGIKNVLTDCQFDWCFLSHPKLKPIIDKEDLHFTFRPKAPDDWTLHVDKGSKSGRYVWLSNFDIDAVLQQYETLEHFKDYKFYKSVPIDFEKINDPLSKVNVHRLLQKGINRFSVVFNLDEHNMPGSHWVALHCDLKQRAICFFDSYGKVPEPEIQDFMAKICVQAATGFDGKKCEKSRSFQMIPLFNATRHQRSSSECGAYGLYTIIQMLRLGGSPEAFQKICKEIRTDEEINSFRKRLFIDRGR